MRKFLLVISCLFGLGSLANAQSPVETLAPFNKENKNAFTLTLNSNKKYVQEALDAKFKESKLKGKSAKGGLIQYAAVDYPTICSQKCDIYTKVDGTDKTATIYLFVSKGYENFVTSNEDAATAENAKAFLTNLITDVQKVELKYKIEEQTKIVEKAEADKKKAEDTKAKLEKQVKEAQDEINKADANLQQQKSLLDQLKAKSY